MRFRSIRTLIVPGSAFLAAVLFAQQPSAGDRGIPARRLTAILAMAPDEIPPRIFELTAQLGSAFAEAAEILGVRNTDTDVSCQIDLRLAGSVRLRRWGKTLVRGESEADAEIKRGNSNVENKTDYGEIESMPTGRAFGARCNQTTWVRFREVVHD